MRAPTPNVLIVENNSRQTELIMELLREVVRAQIDTTDSGERAIELAGRTNYQLIIADCAVGEIDGISLLERVKRVSPNTAVILTSAFATIEEAVKSVRLGADEYFKKPINPEHFKLAVQRCLDRRELFSGDLVVQSMMLLLNTCQLVSGFLEEEKIFESVMGYLRRETVSKAMALFKVVGGNREQVRTSMDIDADVVEVLIESQNFIQACLDEKTPIKVIPRSSATPDVAVFHFRCVGDADYFIVCVSPSWTVPIDEMTTRFRVLQAQIHMTGRNIYNYRGVRHLLYLDEPTGLHNTRYMHLCLDQIFEKRAKTGQGTFSVLFLDVDKFKGVNDRFGHLVGTKILFEMAQILRKTIRKTDYAFRYGGDEFVIVLTDADTGQACAIAEKIRLEVEQFKFLAKEALNIKLTVSIGVANCPEHATSKRDIVDASDNAMYAVKRASRNKVYLAERKAA